MSGVDYTPEAVDARLRRASADSASLASATPRVPMTREAVDLRLREASDLNLACLRLLRVAGPAR